MLRYICFLLNDLHVRRRGSAIIEYAIILAFISVIAVLFTLEYDADIPDDNWADMKGKNIYTTISILLSKVWHLLYVANEAMP